LSEQPKCLASSAGSVSFDNSIQSTRNKENCKNLCGGILHAIGANVPHGVWKSHIAKKPSTVYPVSPPITFQYAALEGRVTLEILRNHAVASVYRHV
ncbi:hypothetical protein, partial [Jiella marina]|uniref:hypothetical protein n=1 Tax=Jiella sp. LLJ827 TaxID=2917712 RepID=UPI002101BC27